MKRILAMAISVLLVVTLALSGTVAYFTDEEEELNIMTVGKINIDLLEDQRNREDNDSPADETPDTLEPFEDGKNFMPVVGDPDGDPKDGWGLPQVEKVPNYIDKIATVKNVGENPAWVRMLVAVPADLEAQGVLHWQTGASFSKAGNGIWNTEEQRKDETNPYRAEYITAELPSGYKLEEQDFDIDGIRYNIYSFTRTTPLEVGETTAASIIGFYLDSKVDWDDETDSYTINGQTITGFDLNNDIVIPVFAQAVQSAGFNSSEDAFIGAGYDNPDGTFNTAFLATLTIDRNYVVASNADAANNAEKVNAGLKAIEATGGLVVITGEANLYSSSRHPDEPDATVEYQFTAGSGRNITLSGGDVRLDNEASWGISAEAEGEGSSVVVENMDISSNAGYAIRALTDAQAKGATISNVEITADGGAGILAAGGGVTTVRKSTVVQSEKALEAANGSTLVVESGSYTGSQYGVCGQDSGSNIVIIGGSFKASTVLKAGSIAGSSTGKIIVEDGSFDGGIEVSGGDAHIVIRGGSFANFSVNAAANCTVTIVGGSFDANPTDYVPRAGYEISYENNLWTVAPAASAA